MISGDELEPPAGVRAVLVRCRPGLVRFGAEVECATVWHCHSTQYTVKSIVTIKKDGKEDYSSEV